MCSSTMRASASRAQLSSQRPRTPSAFLTRTFRHGEYEPRRRSGYARSGAGENSQYQFRRRANSDSVPDLLFRSESGDKFIYHGSCKRASPLRCHRLRGSAGRHKTGFTKAREKTVDGDDVYGGRIGRSVSRMEHDEQTGMDPAVAGKFIANVAMKKRVSPIYTIGASYSFLTFLTRLMSWKTMNKIIGAIYAK